MIAIVSSIIVLRRAASPDAAAVRVSNGCATSRGNGSSAWNAPFIAIALTIGCLASAAAVQAQPKPDAHATRLESASVFLAGAAVAFGAHEGGHLVFDVLFHADPGIGKVDFHGIPFFAITHRSGLPPRQELTISSAGFWVQHAGSEWLLTKRPRLRDERAPFEKGVLAFNVLTSAAYAGAAFARTGPDERDTRGMSASADMAEPWIGGMILAPAVLDGWRYFHPDAKWAVWASRAVKAGMVLLVLK